ncbi:unnamed protein product [Effrenium voratum]|nr:unnamed protein product [Effrenium voratum]
MSRRLRKYTQRLTQLGIARNWPSALQILAEMRAHQLQPNVITYNAGIHACGCSCRWQHVLGLLHEMREVMLAPDNISYNSSLTAFERASQKVKAAQLMATMQAERVQADLVTLNAKISSYAQGSDWERALLTKSAMRERADVVTYGASISACEKGSQWLSALHLLEEMCRVRLQHNAIALSAAISACAKSSRWQHALRLFHTEAKKLADVVAYSAAISACKKGAAWQFALELLRGMKHRGPLPNLVTFCTTMSACERASHWLVAIQLFDELRGLAPAFSVAARRRERAKAVLPRGVPLPAVAGRSWSSDRGQFGSGAVLVLTFLGSAVANRVANRILLVPMAKHSLFLSLATSAVQLTAYALLLACRAWRRLAVRPLRMFLADFWFPLCLTGLCEGCFYPLVFAAAAKLPGGLVQVLNQSIVPYTVLFSVLLLNRSYELIQLAGVAIVLLGVLLAAAVPPGVPHLPGQASLPDVLQCAGAYSLLAMGVTLKDLILKQSQGGEVPMPQELIILTVCTATAAVQLVAQLVALPWVLPELDERHRIFAAGWHQLLGAEIPATPWIALTYWACNVIFSLSALRLVRRASAATVVLTNVVALPMSALIFCFPLPLLERQHFRSHFAVSLLLVVAGNLLYGSTSWRRRTA